MSHRTSSSPCPLSHGHLVQIKAFNSQALSPGVAALTCPAPSVIGAFVARLRVSTRSPFASPQHFSKRKWPCGICCDTRGQGVLAGHPRHSSMLRKASLLPSTPDSLSDFEAISCICLALSAASILSPGSTQGICESRLTRNNSSVWVLAKFVPLIPSARRILTWE
jgi:hypothetical protein